MTPKHTLTDKVEFYSRTPGMTAEKYSLHFYVVMYRGWHGLSTLLDLACSLVVVVLRNRWQRFILLV